MGTKPSDVDVQTAASAQLGPALPLLIKKMGFRVWGSGFGVWGFTVQ